MCNYYECHRNIDQVRDAFRFTDLPNDYEPRYLIRPTSTERVVAVGQEGARRFIPMRWGLVPFWAKDTKTGLTLFNARSETIPTSRTFATPFNKGRRCLIPVDGFYEFSGPKGAKQPHLFKPRDGRVMAFAGLWESWRGSKEAPLAEPLLSYTLATTAPNVTVAPIHNRMPVLLTEAADWDAWLDHATSADRLEAMLRPAPDDLLETHPVSRELLRLKELDANILQPM